MLDQLLDLVEAYLDGKVAVRDLETWVVSSLQAILDSEDEEVVTAVNEVDAGLVEYVAGVLDDDLLEKRLRDVLFRFRKATVLAVWYPPCEATSYRVETSSGMWTGHVAADLSDAEPKDYRLRNLELV